MRFDITKKGILYSIYILLICVFIGISMINYSILNEDVDYFILFIGIILMTGFPILFSTLLKKKSH